MTEEGIEIIWKNIGQDTRCEDGIAGKLQIKSGTRIGGCVTFTLFELPRSRLKIELR